MNMTNLTIIIPVYNIEEYLVRCLDSICSLKHDVHVILIDDGSMDSSGQICDSYTKKDKRFSAVHKHNEGLVLARKSGIDAVRTEYFTFIDSDDYIDSDVYDDMLDELLVEQNKNVDIMCVGMTEEYMGKCFLKHNNYPSGLYAGEALEKLCCGMLSKGEFFNFGILPNTVCKIYRTSFVRSNPISISPCVRIGEDADMTYQLMIKAKEVLISDYAPYHYCRREGSMMWKKVSTESIDGLEEDLTKAFEKVSVSSERMMKQLRDYMAFVTLLCDPQRLLASDSFFAKSDDRIALYGAGGVGRAVRYGMDNQFSLWVDKNSANCKTDDVLPVERLIDDQDAYDKIFIAISSVKTCRDIKASLISMGVKKPIYYYGMENETDEA
ncbi:MAG TPA: hypothetical protein DCX21_00295 [Eubacterium sp.]|nr:hypothetical protein [Eubacterium sp.]